MDRPIKILHVVGAMNRGGAETWLMHVLRNIDRDRFQMDFLVHTAKPAVFDEEIRRLGSRVFSCPHAGNPIRYSRELSRILKEKGPYDVIHSHVHHYSGLVLRVARKAGVRQRIVHSHNDTRGAEAGVGLARKAYLALMRLWINRYATVGLAVSDQAAEALFGKEWRMDTRWKISYCGIDLEPFARTVDKAELRKSLGIPHDALVVGHVGRFDPQKNHDFLVDIAAEVLVHRPDTYFLLVGDGPLRSSIQDKVRRLGIEDRFVFTGVRSDVPDLMLGAMDAFLFPSLHEGLPLALMEAQAAGLWCLYSETISKEVVNIPELCHSIPLSDPQQWGEVIIKRVTKGLGGGARIVDASNRTFGIGHSVESLKSAYLPA